MKTLIRVFALCSLFLASLAWGQTYVTSQGATLHSTVAETLTVSDSVVIFTNVNGVQTNGNLGTLSFTTPILETGNFQTEGTFLSGGEFIIDAPGLFDYVGNFVSAQWIEITLANGTHYYILQGPLSSTEGTGAFVCQTVNLGDKAHVPNVWIKSAKIAQCSFALNN